MTDENLLPSVPNASLVPIVAGMVRGALAILSGAGFTWALTVSGEQQQMVAAAVVGLATVLWSGWQKVAAIRAARRLAAASAVASAQATQQAGTPIAVVVPNRAG